MRRFLSLTIFLILTSCASKSLIPSAADRDPLTLLHTKQIGFEDGRARFREIFCAILNDHGKSLPDYQECEKALIYTDKDSPHSETSVDLGVSGSNFLIGLVPGLAWQCVREWLDDDQSGVQHISTYGYDARL